MNAACLVPKLRAWILTVRLDLCHGIVEKYFALRMLSY